MKNRVPGSGTSSKYFASQEFHLHPAYPLSRFPTVDASATAKFKSPRHTALSGQIDEGTVSPIVVLHQQGRVDLKDGFHRVAAAKAMGKTHLPAYVRRGT